MGKGIITRRGGTEVVNSSATATETQITFTKLIGKSNFVIYLSSNQAPQRGILEIIKNGSSVKGLYFSTGSSWTNLSFYDVSNWITFNSSTGVLSSTGQDAMQKFISSGVYSCVGW